MPRPRHDPEADEKRLHADLVSMRQNSEWAKARRRDRLRLLVAIVIVAAAIRFVPWRALEARVLTSMNVEIREPDAGTF